MSVVSKDAVAEWARMLKMTLDKTIVDGYGRVMLYEPRQTKVSWILVPCTKYKPGSKGLYTLRNEVVAPIMLTRETGVDGLMLAVQARADQLGPEQELALSANIVVGWDNGATVMEELEIYDGAADLKSVHKSVWDKFNVLETKNSFHFYGKGRTKLEDIRNYADGAWLSFRYQSAAYIRVTQAVKGKIVQVELLKTSPLGFRTPFVPAPPEADVDDPDYGF